MLTKRLNAYTGLLTTKTHGITLKQVLPSLPADGLAGKGGSADLAKGYVQQVLRNLDLLLRPRAEWPRRFERARIRTTPAEYRETIVELLKRRILKVLEPRKVVLDSHGNLLGA